MHLWDEEVPHLDWSIYIHVRKPCDDVVIVSFDGCLHGIHAMIVRFDKLDICFIVTDIRLDCFGAFVVEDVELGLEVKCFEVVINLCKRY